jgi:hypothetical protein
VYFTPGKLTLVLSYPLGLGVLVALHPSTRTPYFFLIILLNYPIMDSHFLFSWLHQMHFHIIINPPYHPPSISHLQFYPPFTYLVQETTNGPPTPHQLNRTTCAPRGTSHHFTRAPISLYVLSTQLFFINLVIV